MRRERAAQLFCLAALFTALPAAAAPPLISIRAKSLDAVLGDVETLSTAAHKPVTRDAMLARLSAMFGVGDMSFVERGTPLVVALPLEGMALGQKGFVLALPVRDGVKALAALGAVYGAGTREGELTVFRGVPQTLPDGTTTAPSYYAQVKDGRLLFGQARELVAGFDAAAALAADNVPGSLVLTLQIEPIAPIVKSGLVLARQKIAEMPSPAPGGAEAEGAAGDEGEEGAQNSAGAQEDGGAADQEDAEGEGGGEEGEADVTPAPKFDPRAMAPLFDLYFGIVQDGIDNITRYQLGFAVNGSDAVLHQRITAKANSPLAAFLAAQQQPAVPSNAAQLIPGEAALVAVGQLTWTEPSRSWVRQVVDAYQAALRALATAGSTTEAQRESSARLMDALLSAWNFAETIDCQRGDSAMALDFGASGMTMVQVNGLLASESCRSLLDRSMAAARQKSADAVRTELIGPQKHKTYLIQFAFPKELDTDGSFERMFGPQGMTIRSATVGDLLISGIDPWAAEAVRTALARGATQQQQPAAAGRTGFNARMDLGRLLRGVQELDPGEDKLPAPLLEALSGPAGRLSISTRADGSAGTFEVTLPLGMIEAFAIYSPSPAAAQVAAEVPDDANLEAGTEAGDTE